MRGKVLIGLLGWLLAGCAHNPNTDKQVVYIQVGDSITRGDMNPAGHAPGEFAIDAVQVAGGLGFIKLGYSGETAGDFYRQHRQELLDTIPHGKRVILGVAFGANDVMLNGKEQTVKDILRVVDWARDSAGLHEILIVPVMNRGDSKNPHFTPATFQAFNASRVWVNEQLQQLATRPGVHLAPAGASPREYAAEAPHDLTRYNDEVHPMVLGAKELGEGTIAHGLSSFPGITVK
jgi:hypothetical protein